MLRHARTTALLASLLSFSATSAIADEIIVDPNGLGDTTDVSTAVAIAQEGDLVLVRPGRYDEVVVVDGKSLSIIAQVPDSVRVDGRLVVRSLAAHQRVTLHGLRVVGETDDLVETQLSALEVRSAAGEVHVSNCVFVGADASVYAFTPEGGPGAELSNARAFVARRTRFEGGHGVDTSVLGCTGGDGGFGMRLTISRVALWGCEVLGGDGMTCTFDFGAGPGDGGTAMACLNSDAFVSGCQVRGGGGGDNDDVIPLPAGDGGDGIFTTVPSRVFLVQSIVLGGPGGYSFLGQDGAGGQAFAGSGSVRMLGGRSENHDTPVFVRAQSVHPIEVRGEPGAEATLYIAPRSPFFFDVARRGGVGGTLHAGPLPRAPIPLGTIPPSGLLQASVGIPALPPTATTLHYDFVVVTRQGPMKSVIGAPMRIVALQCGSTLTDCDGNGRADLCDLLEGAADCDENGIPDACQADCNMNGVADTCDIANGTSLDQNGDGIPDECQGQNSTWYVDDSAAPGGDGSLGLPFDTLSDAFGAALSGDEIVVLDGLYTGDDNKNLDFTGREIDVRSMNGAANCVIDLEGSGRAFYVPNIPGSPDVVIEGLTIRRGAGAFQPGLFDGGAILAVQAAPVIRDCVFEDNDGGEGGAVSVEIGTGLLRIEGCTFRGNTGSSGGALSADAPRIEIDDCAFIGNDASGVGGAILTFGVPGESIHVSRSVFFDNSAASSGGALGCAWFGEASVEQCLFAGNSAPNGGAIGGAAGSYTLSHCAIVGNSATAAGGGVRLDFGLDATIVNSIVRGNAAPSGAQIAVHSTNSDLLIAWTNLEGGAAGIALTGGGSLVSATALIDADPLFVDPTGPDGDPATVLDNDYRLGPGSPSVDAADNASIPEDSTDVDDDQDRGERVPLDLDGNPRRVDDPNVPDTGSGAAPVVDHGPYERQ